MVRVIQSSVMTTMTNYLHPPRDPRTHERLEMREYSRIMEQQHQSRVPGQTKAAEEVTEPGFRLPVNQIIGALNATIELKAVAAHGV